MSSEVRSLVKEFYPFAKKRLGFNEPPKVRFFDDAENAQDPLGMTAHYDPSGMVITLYMTNRHPKDILRSFSHELVHHAQNCRGDLVGRNEMGEGYAQKDEYLREMEREAYEQGNLIFRDWEDSKKSGGVMEHFKKRNVALNEGLMKKFGLLKESKVEEEKVEEEKELEEGEELKEEEIEEEQDNG